MTGIIFNGLIRILDTAIKLLDTGKAPIEIAEYQNKPDKEEIKAVDKITKKCKDLYGDKYEFCFARDKIKNNMYKLYFLYKHNDLYTGKGDLGFEINKETLKELRTVNDIIKKYIKNAKEIIDEATNAGS